ncbi:MAG: tol-pal system-associated acyl-CoA thioesterase [Methylococcus sp.]|nr:MAG: tol-pal system-associated acyl-CoA thioesterase [Methylococcus sp.]
MTTPASPAALAFVWPVRVYYEDTDAGGVVYHANYIRFMERARTEFLRHLGFELNLLEREQRLIFAVRDLNVDFRRPARLNDLLEISVDFEAVRAASLLFVQQVSRDGQLLCAGRVRVAALSADSFRPMAIPEFMLERLECFQSG